MPTVALPTTALGLAAFFAAALTATSCAQEKAARTVATGKPLHLVVLVHGVAGNPADFGAMEPALEHHLNAVETPFAWEVVHFAYDTANVEKSTQRFANELHDFLAGQLAGAGRAGRFSIVAHSQGGLLTSLLIANARAGIAGFSPRLLDRMDAWVTLGTPFWGAKSATWARPLAEVMNQAGEVLPGTRQLHDMSFGSDAIFALRHAMLSVDRDGGLNVRALNLAGYVAGFKAAAPFSAGTDEFEDDTAVLVPSARMDFFHATEAESGTATVTAERFKRTALGRFGLVVGIHWLPFEHVQSIIDVPERCVERAGCDHPTFGYVLRHLLGDEVVVSDDNLRRMTAFLLDVNLELAPGHGLSSEDIDLRFGALPDGVQMARGLELYSENEAEVVDDPRYLRITVTGTVEGAWDKDAFGDTVVPFTVHVPGYRPRRVEAPVRPTWSTFIDLRLDPASP